MAPDDWIWPPLEMLEPARLTVPPAMLPSLLVEPP